MRARTPRPFGVNLFAPLPAPELPPDLGPTLRRLAPYHAELGLPAERLPAWIRDARGALKPLPGDRRMMADSADAWMRYWDANIRNRNR